MGQVRPLRNVLLDMADEADRHARMLEERGAQESPSCALRRRLQHEREISRAARGLAEGLRF